MEASPYGWTSKNYVICMCFHCHGTSSYHTTNTLQGRRSTLIHRQYNRDWGNSYSRPPIDPYLTSPLLQNPGGASGCGGVVDCAGGFGSPARRVDRESDDRRQRATVSGTDQQHAAQDVQLQRDTQPARGARHHLRAGARSID